VSCATLEARPRSRPREDFTRAAIVLPVHRGITALLVALTAPLLPDCHDAGSIEASHYDQSCMVDADCVVIAVGTPVEVCCGACEKAAIAGRALSLYQGDLANVCNSYKTPCPPGLPCGPVPTAICVAGMCTTDRSCTEGYFCPDAAAAQAEADASIPEAGASDN
jgi:hypothetical protein